MTTKKQLPGLEAGFGPTLDLVPVMIWACDADRQCTFVNRRWLEFRGRRLDEELGEGWIEGIHPVDLTERSHVFRDALERRAGYEVEFRMLRHDGVYRWVLSTATPTFDEAGEFSGYIGACLDITERKEDEERLRGSEERFRLASEGADVGAWEWDLGDRVFWTPALERMFGYEPGTFPGTMEAYSERLHPDDRERVRALIEQASKDHTELEFEHRLLLPDGEVKTLLGRGLLLFDAAGQPVRMLGVAIDISERRRTEQALQASEARARAVLETAVNGIITIEENGTIESVNRAALGIFGYSEEELLGQNVKMLMPSPYHEEHDGYLSHYRETGERRIIGVGREVEGRRKDGSRFPMELYVSEVDLGGRRNFTGVVNDISDRKRAEYGLQILAQAGIIFNESLDYEITLANLSRLLVPNLADWCTVHVIEDGEVSQVAIAHRDPAMVKWAQELQKKFPPDPDAPQGAYKVIRTGQSELVPVIPRELLEAAAVDDERREIIQKLALKGYIAAPLRTRTEITGAITIVSSESNRVYDEQDLWLLEELGRRAGLAIEKARLYKESELRRAELASSNRAKDEFLGLVSHELRTPITTIFGSARLLSSRGTQIDEESRAELMGAIEEEAQKMVRLIENLLLLARLEIGQKPAKIGTALRKLVEKTVESARGANPAREFQLSFQGPELMPLEPTYFEQVLSNLLSNADKYSPPDQPIEVEVEDRGEQVEFRVLDRGPGVRPEELALIFDSFYRSELTAHLPGKGLGLSVCKRLIEAQGGRIWARARTPNGLQVAFSLPKAEEKV